MSRTRVDDMRPGLRTRLGILGCGVALLATGLSVRTAHAVSSVQPACPAPTATDPAAFVCPFIATSNSADDFPGADAPFGMMQWSPDTTQRPSGGGYEYDDSLITGFSLTHVSGPGCGIGGDVPIMPWVGNVGNESNDQGMPFQHATPAAPGNESATPGYYQVQLDEPSQDANGVPNGAPVNINTELTVTPRSGLGRFTFPSGTDSNLMFDLNGSQMHVDNASASVSGNTITGSVQVGGPGNGFCGESDGYTVYFSAEFSAPITACGTYNGSTVTPDAGFPGTVCTAGGGNNLYVTFDTSSNPVVLARTGISYVSAANALLNASTEDPGWNQAGGFDAVKTATYNAWDHELSKISVTGGTSDEQMVFYSALYHALLHPNIFSDVNGQYPGYASYQDSSNQDTIYTAPSGHAQYANFSGWDVYRTEMQLVAIVDPAVGSDIATSMLNDYAQTNGTFPKWGAYNGESYVMDGDPTEAELADLYAFGATGFDTTTALHDMVTEATTPSDIRTGLGYYDQQHFTPVDGSYSCCWWGGSVSTTQEYTMGDEATAQMAAALGDTADATTLMSRAQNWQWLFNPNSGLNGFMQPKYQDEQFLTPFDPAYGNTVVEGGYTEANAYQYTPMVNQNLHALINAMGGNSAYVHYLDNMFAHFGDPGGNLNSPVTGPGAGTATNATQTTSIFGGGLVPFAWMGNEPSVEIPWEYDFAGAPYRTQDVVRRVAVEIYTNSPTGEPGNDDLGTMSAALVWEDLGLYPITPGSANMALASSLFTSATITLPSGNKLTINAPNATDSNRYIQDMKLNGVDWNQPWLPASVMKDGGTLTEDVGGTANQAWGTDASAQPPSYSTGEVPAIAGTTPSGVLPDSTTGTPVSLSVSNVTDAPIPAISWTATGTGGITVSPFSGTITNVPACTYTAVAEPVGPTTPCDTASTSVTVTSPATDTSGLVTFKLTAANGQALPDVVDEINCSSGPQPGEDVCAGGGSCTTSTSAPSSVDNLAPYYNNVGISDDCTNAGNFDGEAYSYSDQALIAAGLQPGGGVIWRNHFFNWTSGDPGTPNVVEFAGQTIPLSAAPGLPSIGLLGSASNGPVTSNVVVTYSDGSQSTVPVCMDDWTLGGSNGGPNQMTCTSNGFVAATAYRNFPTGKNSVLTDVFGAEIPLDTTKTATALTLEPSAGLGQIHIFAMSTQSMPLSLLTPSTSVAEAPLIPGLVVTGLGGALVAPAWRRRRRARRAAASS